MQPAFLGRVLRNFETGFICTTTTLAFDEAVAYCAEQGGSLFEPTYNGQDQAVATWASGIFQEAFWLGITDDAVEGE